MKVFIALLGIFLISTTSLTAQVEDDTLKTIYSDLDKPTSIYATQNHLFVVESGKHRVLKLDHSGKLIETLGGLGSGDYQFDTPIDIDATNGLKIYVSDYRNSRVQIFDRRFQYLGTINVPQERRSFKPTQLVVNDFGELFVYDKSSQSILKFDENGNNVDEFQIPSAIQQISDIQMVGRQIYVLDFKSNQYHVFIDNGLQVRSYPLEGAIQLYIDEKREEWLVSPSSIQNSKESKEEILFSEDIVIKDVVKVSELFYILTEESILSISTPSK